MNDERAQELTRNDAARKLGVSHTTVLRWAEAKKLTRLSNGFFLADEVEALAAERVEQRESGGVAAVELREGFAQATDHAERVLRLLEGPMKQLMASFAANDERNARLIEDYAKREIESMGLVREVLLAKHEEARIAADSEHKRAVLERGMALLSKNVPKLMEQIGGNNLALKFLRSLSPEQIDAVGALEMVLGPGQKEHFAALFEAAFPERNEPEPARENAEPTTEAAGKAEP